MSNKWKIASMVLMVVGAAYNIVSDIVDDKNQEERMKEIADERISEYMERH